MMPARPDFRMLLRRVEAACSAAACPRAALLSKTLICTASSYLLTVYSSVADATIFSLTFPRQQRCRMNIQIEPGVRVRAYHGRRASRSDRPFQRIADSLRFLQGGHASDNMRGIHQRWAGNGEPLLRHARKPWPVPFSDLLQPTFLIQGDDFQ